MTPAAGTTVQTHLRRMADVLAEAREDTSDDVPPRSLLFGLRRLVPCDTVSFSELDIPTRRSLNEQETPCDFEECASDAYWRWRHQYLMCQEVVARPPATPIALQMRDFMSVRELTNLPLYTEFLRPAKSIASVALPTAPGRTRVFILCREDPKPFTDDEMTTLYLLGPHLYAIYRDAALRRRQPVRLTERELDVLRCVALGMATPQIAAQLTVSPSTVRKHLENVFGRLGVSSRAAAVARVFPAPGAL
ncbi:helix-turn-helix domain-containing protein [Streptomyces sp. NBC_01451]|uniref:helix-turn-helix domain-containing protein n=1 Tax=Streptomyces sp. NBC_01451 TaxID=2903872 RepID=UPI002E3448D9|nr:helix-turn-helix transcriptional regulator [Streptomyces sp. NBC_01451]